MSKKYNRNNKKSSKFLYSVVALSWSSGILFFIFKEWVRIEDTFSVGYHPLQNIFLKIHGASAFVLMILYGYFIAVHVLPGLKKKQLSKLGRTMTVTLGSLIVSAYLLYYVGHDLLRECISYFHVTIGFLLPFILASHIISIKKQKGITNEKK